MTSLPRLPLALLALTAVVFTWSGIGPRDRFTWFMEVLPVILAAPVLVLTWKRFPLTPLVYVLLFVHGCILMIGGKYTYAEVPPGYWLRDVLHLARNPWDRLGHFAQGFVPAMLMREILLRTSPLQRGKWLFVLVTSVCLAFSAFYEFIEWWSALATGSKADAFLGTQGDPWDTQWDMFTAFIGAIAAQALLSRVQDRQLAALRS